jgi:hypothetical protein
MMFGVRIQMLLAEKDSLLKSRVPVRSWEAAARWAN